VFLVPGMDFYFEFNSNENHYNSNKLTSHVDSNRSVPDSEVVICVPNQMYR